MPISPTNKVDATDEQPRGRQLRSRGTAPRASDGPRATTVGAAPGRVAAAPYWRPQSRRARSIGSSQSSIGREQSRKRADHHPSIRDCPTMISRSQSRARTRSRRRGEPGAALPRFRSPFLDQVVGFYGPIHATTLPPRSWPSPLPCLPSLSDLDADFSPSFSPEHLTSLYVAQHGAGGSDLQDHSSPHHTRKLSYHVPEEDEAWAAVATAEAPAESPASGNARRQGEEDPTTQSASFSCPYEHDTRHDRARRRLSIISMHLVPQSTHHRSNSSPSLGTL